MDKSKIQQMLNKIDSHDSDDYLNLISMIKHNICQNMRIARKLSKLEPNKASELLGLDAQSLRRIEAENDRDLFSTKVFIMAVMIYEPDANFYFRDWKDNESLLQKNDN